MTATTRLVPLDRVEVPPFPISPRLRGQLVYFAASPDQLGAAGLGPDEYWFRRDEVERVLEDGVVYLVSPLDTANMTEVEISEEQERMLNWLRDHGIERVRVEG